MKSRGLLLLAAWLLAQAASACQLQQAPATDDTAAWQSRALALLPCLGHPDPKLRDEGAFETFAAWMRDKRLQPATLQSMRAQLVAVLRAPPDAAGVHQPFAILLLAELARADRLQPYLSLEERAELVSLGATWLEQVRDYRGLSDTEGWRHGVAHAADLALQLGLNPALDRAQRQRLLQAVSSQVLADGTRGGHHAYRFGEGQRLARAALNLHLQLGTSAAEWAAWLQAIAAPIEPGGVWDELRLARMHNLREFLWPLMAGVLQVPDAVLREAWLKSIQEVLQKLG
ncbi:DUF2785 domain-containing protein [Roseateles paludis]|uniref:DUF2785 domain-containing protein n=1 Tax=Roseateles paludis TaxID=3145238 RepID=A0ABV0G386_9BURK